MSTKVSFGAGKGWHLYFDLMDEKWGEDAPNNVVRLNLRNAALKEMEVDVDEFGNRSIAVAMPREVFREIIECAIKAGLARKDSREEPDDEKQ